MREKLRWRLWAWLSSRRGICPANAHTMVIYGDLRHDPRISSMCRQDCERNGECWCGKLRAEGEELLHGV